MGSTPKADPRQAEAAMMSAQTGKDYLKFMQGQSDISNAWAKEDRARYKTVFQPMEDKMIAEAEGYDTPERRAMEVSKATADVRQSFASSRKMSRRNLASMGVDPRSGRSVETDRRGATDEALASAGAANVTRSNVENTGRQMRASVVNLGQGLAVNPGSSLGMATSSGSSGFQGAMRGYQQQASIFNSEFQQRMQAHNSKMNTIMGVAGAAGSILGATGLGAKIFGLGAAA